MSSKSSISYETANRLVAVWSEASSLADACERAGIKTKDARKHNRYRRMAEDMLNVQLTAHNQSFSPKLNIREQTYKYNREGLFNAVIFSDAHFWPGHDTPAFQILLKIIKDVKPKLIIDNRDSLDRATISRHPALSMESLPTLLEELDNCKDKLAQIEKAAKGADKIRNMGNHDQRYEMKLASVVPQFKGLNGFAFADLFPNWTHTNSTMINNEIFVKHRWHGGGIHAAYNNTMKAGKTIITSHTHKLGIREWTDLNGTRYGIETGFISNQHSPAFDYVEDNPLNWQEGFVVLTIDGGVVYPELVRVINGKALFRGKSYTA